jgi:glycerophosphoryl diester phosphodiesterase
VYERGQTSPQREEPAHGHEAAGSFTRVGRRITPVLLGFILSLAGGGSAGAVAPDPNPWLTKRFLNIAHQGGEDEAPSSTMFAFRSAVAERGADMLELDVQLTSDGHLVVIHDDTVSRTTNGPSERPDSQVRDMTLAEVQALDAAYWFRPGSYSHDPDIPEAEFIYRGIRTGERAPPAGYTAEDFRIPALREVLDAFPDTPINIEIKQPKTCEGGVECDSAALGLPTAEALAALLDEPPYSGRTDLIVVSFSDLLIGAFNQADAAPKVALAAGVAGVATYAATGAPPIPDVAAFQVPPDQNGLAVPEMLLQGPTGQDAHADGYAVHVWPNGTEPDGEDSYARLIALGIDGYMSSQPGRLHAFLCSNEIPRPDGSDRCPGPVTSVPGTEPSTSPSTPAASETPGAGARTRRCRKGKRLKRGRCVAKKRVRR